MTCEGCLRKFSEIISDFWKKDEAVIDLFKEHGVVPVTKVCPRCNKKCALRSDKNLFVCHTKTVDKKHRRVKRCGYTSSMFKGTWLENTTIKPWQVLQVMNFFLQNNFTQRFYEHEIQLNSKTVVAWKNFCSAVCMDLMNNQAAIGGPGIIVEIDESKFGKRLSEGGVEGGIWVFGGIERVTKKKFVVPVEERDAATVVPLIQKFIRPGTIIYSDCWEDYDTLENLGYYHKTVEEDFVDPEIGVHIHNIKHLWQNVKAWVFRAGNRKDLFERNFAKELFCSAHPDHDSLMHHFLLAIASRFPPSQ